MNQGRQRTYLRVNNMKVNINEQLTLHPIGQDPLVEVELLYEPAIKPNEDDPGCSEYVDLIKVKALGDAYFEDETKRVFLVLRNDCDLLDFMYDHDWEAVINQIAEINKRESEL